MTPQHKMFDAAKHSAEIVGQALAFSRQFVADANEVIGVFETRSAEAPQFSQAVLADAAQCARAMQEIWRAFGERVALYAETNQ